jgi:hypothetical protein
MKRLFVDIETSPNIGLFWRAGYKQTITPDSIIEERKVICVSYKWAGGKVKSLKWDADQDDATMLAALIKVMNEADEIVAHNGDRFDIKWIRTRCLIHGIRTYPTYKTVDTLKLAKYGFYFNSNKLDYIAQLLGVGGKTSTNYGMWKDVLLKNDRKVLNEMVRYCENDVEILENVYNALAPYCVQKTHVGVEKGLEKWTCAHCGSERVIGSKQRITALGTPRQQMSCKDCGRYYTISATSYAKYKEAK